MPVRTKINRTNTFQVVIGRHFNSPLFELSKNATGIRRPPDMRHFFVAFCIPGDFRNRGAFLLPVNAMRQSCEEGSLLASGEYCKYSFITSI